MSAHKHRPARPRGAWQYVYDGRQLLAVIEQHADGWHVISSHHDIGAYPDREAALRFANALITSPST